MCTCRALGFQKFTSLYLGNTDKSWPFLGQKYQKIRFAMAFQPAVPFGWTITHFLYPSVLSLHCA